MATFLWDSVLLRRQRPENRLKMIKDYFDSRRQQQRNRWESSPHIPSTLDIAPSRFTRCLKAKHQGCEERRSRGELFNITWLSRELFRITRGRSPSIRRLARAMNWVFIIGCQREHFIRFGTVRSTVARSESGSRSGCGRISILKKVAVAMKKKILRPSWQDRTYADKVGVYVCLVPQRSGMAILITIS